jgi:hypothetical protein
MLTELDKSRKAREPLFEPAQREEHEAFLEIRPKAEAALKYGYSRLSEFILVALSTGP